MCFVKHTQGHCVWFTQGDKKVLPKLTFVLGGAASGKSAWAEDRLLASGLAPVYLATAQMFDTEMRRKVAVHQGRRDTRWRTIEAPLDLSPALGACTKAEAVLLDCATMWLSNQMLQGNDPAQQTPTLLAALQNCPAPVIVVSNEVGHGIVPDTALGRQFREAQGRLNIALAAQADLAVLVVAGLPQVLKGALS